MSKNTVETMALCPRCRKDVRADPDESCSLCRGAGVVPANVAAAFRVQAAAAGPPTKP